MKKVLCSLALLACASCFADPVELEIPGQHWKVKFDAPPLTKKEEKSENSQYYYLANSDRLNLSLNVEQPGCPGGVTPEDNYNCILPKLKKLPGVVEPSIEVTKSDRDVQLTYVMYVNVKGKVISIVNHHILFAHNGLWGDLHLSMVKPTTPEILELLKFEQNFSVVDIAQ